MLRAPCAELSPLGTGKLSFQQPQVLHRLALELQPHLGSLSPAQVSRCARSFASLRWLSRPLAEAIAQVRPGGQGGLTCPWGDKGGSPGHGEAGDTHLCRGWCHLGAGGSEGPSPVQALSHFPVGIWDHFLPDLAPPRPCSQCWCCPGPVLAQFVSVPFPIQADVPGLLDKIPGSIPRDGI